MPIALALIALSVCCNCLFALMIVLHRRSVPLVNPKLSRFPKVSVLLTVRDLDDGLEENMVSVLSSEYPDFEVLVAVDSMEDPCVPVLNRARARFPSIRSTIVATGSPDSGNPKIDKLCKLEKMSDAALFWVLDSDTRVFPHTLVALVHEHLRSGAHLVFSPIRCFGAHAFGSILEMSYVNFFLSGSMLAAWSIFRQRVVVGKSLLIDSHALRQFGGFVYFADVLAEDHWLGESFHKSGFIVTCNYAWVKDIKETTTVRNYFDRVSRWAKLRFCLKTPVYFLEILFNPLGLALLLLPFMKNYWISLAVLIVVFRLILEYLVFFSLNAGDRRKPGVLAGLALAVIVKDLMMLFVYFIPFFNRRVNWRGRRITIEKDTRITAANANPAFQSTGETHGTIVTVLMGLGHLRAAYPLLCRNIGTMVPYGSKPDTPAKEYRIWHGMRRTYYFISRAGEMPVLGSLLIGIMTWMQRIEPYYSRRDHSKPGLPVRYLEYLINRRGLCRGLVEKLKDVKGPIIHTYFATAIAADKAFGVDSKKENYLIICDSDFHRVWVPKEPRKSNLRYCVPCSQARRRLIAYGVLEKNIFSTGFPLPAENTGTQQDLEVLKADVFQRLLRLDPGRRFFAVHDTEVMRWLDRPAVPLEGNTDPLTVTFAIGGAGAQFKLACAILRALRTSIREGRIRLVVSVGVQKAILVKVLRQINILGLISELDRNVRILFDADPFRYFDKFNLCMRTTDVLWTKPSELVFYAGLGIPVLMAPPIGTHEELNRYLLQEIHAGIEPPGAVEFCGQWLIDLRNSGRLAESAWDGFLKARKLGTFKIERLVLGRAASESLSPLDR